MPAWTSASTSAGSRASTWGRIDIDTKARVDGASVGTVNIDPWVYGAYVGCCF
jgi:hypothetical protein